MVKVPSIIADRYRVDAILGEGGMAAVYRAYDLRLQVRRALKVLSPAYARQNTFRSRFITEAQTMAAVEYRGIVRVYDVDQQPAGPAYIVMELVEGGSLVDWMELNGQMPCRMAVEVVIKVCEALEVAHAAKIIHRDIKPHNILVSLSGEIKVTDFGIARAMGETSHLTRTGAILGTWGYMAPEQRSNARDVDERADIYSVGALLFSLLTNSTPTDLFALDRDPELASRVPAPLLPLLKRLTNYDRDHRPSAMNEVIDALSQIREQLPEDPPNTPSLVTPPGFRSAVIRGAEQADKGELTYQVEQEERMNRRLSWVGFVALLGMLVGGFVMMNDPPDMEVPEAPPAATTPAPVPVAQKEEPAVPAPAEPVQAPAPATAIVPKKKAPAKPSACIEKVQPPTSLSAASTTGSVVKVWGCEGREVSLSYRVAGSQGFTKVPMRFALGFHSVRLRVPSGATEIEWFVSGPGVRHGSASKPKVSQVVNP